MDKKPTRVVDEATLLRVAGDAYPDGLPDTYREACAGLRSNKGGDTLRLFVAMELCEASQIDNTGTDDKPARYDVDRAISAMVTAISELDSVVSALEELGRTTPLPGVDGGPAWVDD